MIAYFGKPDQNLVQTFDQFQRLVLLFGAYRCVDLILRLKTYTDTRIFHNLVITFHNLVLTLF